LSIPLSEFLDANERIDLNDWESWTRLAERIGASLKIDYSDGRDGGAHVADIYPQKLMKDNWFNEDFLRSFYSVAVFDKGKFTIYS